MRGDVLAASGFDEGSGGGAGSTLVNYGWLRRCIHRRVVASNLPNRCFFLRQASLNEKTFCNSQGRLKHPPVSLNVRSTSEYPSIAI